MALIICNTAMLLSCLLSLSMAIKLGRRSAELKKITERLQKMERVYKRMAEELHNMAESTVLRDSDGVQIFFEKLNALHQQFMVIGKKD